VSAQIRPLRISAYTATTATGVGRKALHEALAARRTGLRANDFESGRPPTFIGRVDGLETAALPPELAEWECRNNRLAWLGLQADGFIEAALAARSRYGAHRLAIVLGTSTSSIGASEEAYRSLEPDGTFPPALRRPIVHTVHSLGDFVQAALGLTGICVTVATACSSSAKVFAQAERLMRAGLCDAVLVGGVDTLCGSVLFGFHALELVSPDVCRPFDAERRGINLGEAAGFALIEHDDGAARAIAGPRFVGYGESSDAHHMSTPHPEGLGAKLAMEEALSRAALAPDAIDYVNAHGTASQKNDEVEARAIDASFPATTHASSTKGWMGHTLGAAGIVEAAVCLLSLESGLMPGTLNLRTLDPACGPQIRAENETGRVRYALSSSFGFGGNNCALIFAAGRNA
jgi:3-oxoacyl-[acyl-carrier-protein] synthase I